jgi:PilZ domain
MVPVVDNRAARRCVPSDDTTYVHIIPRAGERITRARLLNISTGGALISTYSLVATGEKVLVQFDRAPEIGWFPAEVIHVKRPRKVGIRFNPPLSGQFAAASIREDRRVAKPDEQETVYLDAHSTMDMTASRASSGQNTL